MPATSLHTERPIPLLPTLIRWWQGLRAPEVSRWQERHRFGWDAADGRHGGAERTVWKHSLIDMERFECRAGEKDQGAITLVLELAEAFELVSLEMVCGVRSSDAFVLCGYCENQRRVQYERCEAEPLQTTAILLGRVGATCSFALCLR